MPQLTGIELLREVRRVDLDVPVILMSGSPDVETAASAVEYGAFRYLTKPLDIARDLRRDRQGGARARARADPARGARDRRRRGAAPPIAPGSRCGSTQALDKLWMAFQPIVRAQRRAVRLRGADAVARAVDAGAGRDPRGRDAACAGSPRSAGACARSAAAGAATREGALFVNLHPDDLADAELVDPASPLAAIASRVVLEITERASCRRRRS